MVVLPRNRRLRARNPHGDAYAPDGGSPTHGQHHPYHPYGYGNGNGGNGGGGRLFNHQSVILLLAGMGIGYLVLPMVVVNQNQGYVGRPTIGLNEVVRNLEQKRNAAATGVVGSGTSAGGGNGLGLNGSGSRNGSSGRFVHNKAGMGDASSPMNMMHNSQRDTAALLRGDASKHAFSGELAGAHHTFATHRRASEDDEVVDEAEKVSGVEIVNSSPIVQNPVQIDQSDRSDPQIVQNNIQQTGNNNEGAASNSALPHIPLAVNAMSDSTNKKIQHMLTFQEIEDEQPDLSEVEKRFAETQKLLASQSIPTATNPHVMKTPSLPDSKRKKILVTGGAGFVGSHLVDKLMMEGHEVIVVDNFFTGQRKNVDHWMHHPRFSLVVHDVTEPIMLEVDEIYHLACPASPPHYQYNPVKTIKTSTMGTINMLGLAKRVKAKILLTSTSEIYGDPKVHPQPESYWGNVNTIGPRSCYDEGKRVAETMMYSYRNQNNVDVRVARIFNTFGPRMHPNDGRVVSNFIIQALQDKPMTIYGDGSQTRSFQYVSDLVDGLHALMNGNYDMPVNLGNPDEYTVKHFAEYIKEITGSGSEISFLARSQDDPTQRKPDISTAKRELDWEPKVTVKEGLQKTISYFSRVLDESGEIIPTGQEASKPKPKVAKEV